jgi:hypothetical protein
VLPPRFLLTAMRCDVVGHGFATSANGFAYVPGAALTSIKTVASEIR